MSYCVGVFRSCKPPNSMAVIINHRNKITDLLNKLRTDLMRWSRLPRSLTTDANLSIRSPSLRATLQAAPATRTCNQRGTEQAEGNRAVWAGHRLSKPKVIMEEFIFIFVMRY